MTSPQPQQHDDPIGEARAQMVQALAVLSTVGEAAARWAVAGVQNRAARAEQRAVAAAVTERANQVAAQAHAEQDQAARRLMDQAFDDRWLDQADLRQAADLWRTAAMYAASGDQRATEAMRRVHERLRHLHPGLMDAYDRHRAAGLNLAAAMRAATHDVWLGESRANGTGRARPHGNTADPPAAVRGGANGRAIGTKPDPYGRRLVDDLDAAVRAEVARLAIDVDPQVLDRVQRQWRSAGHAPAADAATLLAQFARDLRVHAAAVPGTVVDEVDAAARRAAAEAHADALTGRAAAHDRAAGPAQATADDPATPADEHHAGLKTATSRDGAADRDTDGADQQRRLGRAFPPLRRVDTTHSPNLSPRPAEPGRAQRKGHTR